MKLHKPQLFIALFLLTSFCYGQQKKIFGATFSLSDEVTTEGGIGHGLIGSDGKYVYTMGNKGIELYFIPIGTKFIVNKWDEKMNMVAIGEIPMETDEYKLTSSNFGLIKLVGDKLIHFILQKDNSENKNNVFIVEYDKETFEIIKTIRVANFDYDKNTSLRVFFAHNGINQSEFCLFLVIEKEDITEVTFLVINEELDVDLEKKIEINRPFDELWFYQLSINGNIISMIHTEDNEDGRLEKMIYHMYSITDDTHLKLPLHIDRINKKIRHFKIAVSDDQKLHFVGFYEDNDKTKAIGGAFDQVYDLKKEKLISHNIMPFSIEFLTSSMYGFEKKRAVKRATRGKSFDPYKYFIREVISNTDGSSTIVGECYTEYTTTYSSYSGSSNTKTYYVHGDIILMRTNKGGEIEWVDRHQRIHSSTDPSVGSFIFKDRNEDSFNILYSSEEGNLVMLDFDKHNGTSEAKTVFSNDEIGNVALVLSNPAIVNEEKIIIQTTGKVKNLRIVTIEFDKDL